MNRWEQNKGPPFDGNRLTFAEAKRIYARLEKDAELRASVSGLLGCLEGEDQAKVIRQLLEEVLED